jgi:hypothetical protein
MRNAIIAGMALLAASPAVAAETPKEVKLGGEPSTAEDLLILHRFSFCVAAQHRQEVETLLASDFTTDAYCDHLRHLAQNSSNCTPVGRLRFNGVLFAGDMAESLLENAGALRDLAARTAFDPQRPPLRARGETEMMGLCTVRAAPASVEAVLKSRVASDEEATAMRALTPEIGSCLKAGTTLRLNRPMIRAVLALAAQRLAAQAGAAPRPVGN